MTWRDDWLKATKVILRWLIIFILLWIVFTYLQMQYECPNCNDLDITLKMLGIRE